MDTYNRWLDFYNHSQTPCSLGITVQPPMQRYHPCGFGSSVVYPEPTDSTHYGAEMPRPVWVATHIEPIVCRGTSTSTWLNPDFQGV